MILNGIIEMSVIQGHEDGDECTHENYNRLRYVSCLISNLIELDHINNISFLFQSLLFVCNTTHNPLHT